MISHWASGHHAKLAGLCTVYQGQHSREVWWQRSEFSGCEGQRRPGAWVPVPCVHGAVTRPGEHLVNTGYTRWCEGNLKHNAMAPPAWSANNHFSVECCSLLCHTNRLLNNHTYLISLSYFLTFWECVDVLLNISISGFISVPTDAELSRKK